MTEHALERRITRSARRPEHVNLDRSRIVDRLDPKMVTLLTVLGFGLPVAGYLVLLSCYSLNVIVGDQWNDISVINGSYAHFFDWSSMWALHGENRIFFPNIIVVLLAHTVHYNIQVEEYLSAVMLIGATALLIWAHKRRSPSTPWLYYCPVAILTFSIVQWQNTLWGFQMAWFLVLLSLAVAVVLLDKVRLTWFVFFAAIGAGVVGSYSSLQGLLIWPAGLILLYHRRRAWHFFVAWIVASSAVIFGYFYHFNNPAGRYPYAMFKYPLVTAKFYLLLIGDVIGLPINNGPSPNLAVVMFGLLIVIVAVVMLLAYGLRRDENGGSPVGLVLICVGLVFAVTVTQGRIIFGYNAASLSRYTTFDLLVLVGLYLTILEPPLRRREIPQVKAAARSVNFEADQEPVPSRTPAWFTHGRFRWIRAVVVAAVAVQLSLGINYGLPGAQGNFEYKSMSVKVLRNIDHTGDGAVQYYLDIFEPASWIRRQAAVAEEHRLSLFDNAVSSGSMKTAETSNG